MNRKSEKVLIVGGSISGLFSALAFSRRGHDVTIVDRDPNPPASLGADRSGEWKRTAAPHSPHLHLMSGRLREIVRENYPDLLQDLLEADVKPLPFYDLLHPDLRHKLKPMPGDDEIALMLSRRTTLELVLRRYVQRQENIVFLAETQFESLIMEEGSNLAKVVGARVTSGEKAQEIAADIVLDATGRGSRLKTDLANYGVDVEDEQHRCNTVYYSRQYRMRPGRIRPNVTGSLGASLDYMIAGVTPSDNGHIQVTLATFRDDPLLHGNLSNTALFDKVCASIPLVAPFVDPENSEPVTDIITWANMDFFWRSMVKNGVAQVLGFFFVGDSSVRTNPKYGRGCTWGAIEAHLLAETVATVQDPAERVLHYEAALTGKLRAEWEILCTADKDDYRKFALSAGLANSTPTDWVKGVMQRHVLNRLVAGDPDFLRSFFKVMNGMELPSYLARQMSPTRIASTFFVSGTVKSVARSLSAGPSRKRLAEWVAEAPKDRRKAAAAVD